MNRSAEDLDCLERYRVCSDHFLDSDYIISEKRRRLKKTAIPNTDPTTQALLLWAPLLPEDSSSRTRNPRRTVTKRQEIVNEQDVEKNWSSIVHGYLVVLH